MTLSAATPRSWSVRPASLPADSAGILDVANAFDSEPMTSDELERLWRSWSPDDPRLRLVATDCDGQVVGTAHCRRRALMSPGLFSLNVYVAVGWTRRGVGSELVRQCEQFVLSSGGARVTAFVPDEFPGGRPFAERHGYRESRRLFESVLPVSEVSEERIAEKTDEAFRDGLRASTLAELGDTEANRRKLYGVVAECDLDEPATIEYGGVTWEDYQRTVFDAPWYRPEGVFVARSGDDWAGVHVIGPMEGSTVADMVTDFTGVRRPFRGRGLATALKLLGVRFARETGGTRILTHNDSANAPMLAVNQNLGFVARSGLLMMTKDLKERP